MLRKKTEGGNVFNPIIWQFVEIISSNIIECGLGGGDWWWLYLLWHICTNGDTTDITAVGTLQIFANCFKNRNISKKCLLLEIF